VAIVCIRLKDTRETVFFQSIIGTYSHLGWVRTEKPEEGIMRIYTTDDLVDELREVLRSLRTEIEFRDVQI
jgi:hypothetical protein